MTRRLATVAVAVLLAVGAWAGPVGADDSDRVCVYGGYDPVHFEYCVDIPEWPEGLEPEVPDDAVSDVSFLLRIPGL